MFAFGFFLGVICGAIGSVLVLALMSALIDKGVAEELKKKNAS